MTRFVSFTMMMMAMMLLSSVILLKTTSAFIVPHGTHNGVSSSSNTAANLVPEQGRQLVAYSQDYLSKRAKESAHRASNLTSPRFRHSRGSNGGGGSGGGGRSSSSAGSNHIRKSSGIVGFVTRLLGQQDQERGRMMEIISSHPDYVDDLEEED